MKRGERKVGEHRDGRNCSLAPRNLRCRERSQVGERERVQTTFPATQGGKMARAAARVARSGPGCGHAPAPPATSRCLGRRLPIDLAPLAPLAKLPRLRPRPRPRTLSTAIVQRSAASWPRPPSAAPLSASSDLRPPSGGSMAGGRARLGQSLLHLRQLSHSLASSASVPAPDALPAAPSALAALRIRLTEGPASGALGAWSSGCFGWPPLDRAVCAGPDFGDFLSSKGGDYAVYAPNWKVGCFADTQGSPLGRSSCTGSRVAGVWTAREDA